MSAASPQDLPLDRLEAWLRGHAEGFRGPVAAERFSGGQSNPTYKLVAGSGEYVLRRKPPGPLLPSAHAVDREFRVMRALADTPVPVPRVYALCEDEAVIGSAFYVMEHLDGRIFWDQRLPGIAPSERAAMFDSMNAVIAALHSVDYEAVGLGDFGRPGNYMGRQIARWSRQYRASETEAIPAMDALIDWLPQHLPEEGAPAIVHGDYRMDNLVFHKTEPRVIGILDWEWTTIGDPPARSMGKRGSDQQKRTPLRPSGGEREGPVAKQWEGEVGLGERSGIPHLTPTLSAPGGGEGAPVKSQPLAAARSGCGAIACLR